MSCEEAERDGIRRLVVRIPNWVGDVVMATPALRALKKGFPAAHITYVLRPYTERILESSPWHDDTIEVGEGVRDLWQVARQLRSKKFELGVLLTNTFRSALLFQLGRVKRRVGYAREARSLFLTDKLAPLKEKSKFLPAPMVDYYLNIADYLGCSTEGRQLELFVNERCAEQAERLLGKYELEPGKRMVLVTPGAAFGSAKCWPPECFARVADLLTEKLGVQVMVVTGPKEVEVARAIEAASRRRIFNLVDEKIPLDLLKALVKRSALLISNDSGPRHFAAALDVPVITIIGPTDPRWSETGFARETVIHKELECSPCMLKCCPTDHRCMTLITPEEVFKVAKAKLAEGKLAGACHA